MRRRTFRDLLVLLLMTLRQLLGLLLMLFFHGLIGLVIVNRLLREGVVLPLLLLRQRLPFLVVLRLHVGPLASISLLLRHGGRRGGTIGADSWQIARVNNGQG